MGFQCKGLAHIGLPCLSLEESINFYETIGFVKTAYLADNNGYEVAMMKAGSCILELYAPVGTKGYEQVASTGILNHVAVEVDDLDAAYQTIKEMGLPIISKDKGIETMYVWGGPSRLFFTLGFNGERIEFFEKHTQ